MEEAGVKAVLPVPEVTLRGCRGGRKSLQVTQKKGTPAVLCCRCLLHSLTCSADHITEGYG